MTAATPMTIRVCGFGSAPVATSANGMAVRTSASTKPMRYDLRPCALPLLVRSMSKEPWKIDDREDADPDDVEEMPEQAETSHAGDPRRGQPLDHDLAHHDEDEEEAEAHVQAMGADQREERRQEAAAVRTGAGLNQAVKLPDLQPDEAEPEHEGDGEPRQHCGGPA